MGARKGYDMLKKLVYILSIYPEKLAQFNKLCDRCYYLTSDTGITVSMEMYDGNIVRLVITGTRCQMTVCYNALTWELLRKPRGAKPWFTAGPVQASGEYDALFPVDRELNR